MPHSPTQKSQTVLQRPARTLVLAFDGTGDEFDEANTNVVNLCAVLDMDCDKQLVYYQPGIGTYTPPGVRGSIQNKIAKMADRFFGWYLAEHVMDGYEFLMNHHIPGDKICIFGFSRGAYTARALAGMLHHVGLLSQGNHEQVPCAWNLYKQQSPLGQRFKKIFCKTVEIEMLGVWDTVASVGYLVPRTLPFTSNDTIKTFRHAISLDEHRKRFGVELWENYKDVGVAATPSRSNDPHAPVMEVWFSGCHCDVGGGNVKDADHTAANLANISLRWMLNHIWYNSSVVFSDSALDEYNIPNDCVRRSHYPRPKFTRTSSEETVVGEPEPIKNVVSNSDLPTWAEADHRDLFEAKFRDPLERVSFWWVTQLVTWSGKAIDSWGTRIFPLNKPNFSYNQVHYSVWKRMELRSEYIPRTLSLPAAWDKQATCPAPQ
ncbi:hypothetical protein CPB86DRAFT_819843 [Serendipita vermifera]|nr:hypothetical protein CPB86DRAFT_819843 [Serendipita vermifera]